MHIKNTSPISIILHISTQVYGIFYQAVANIARPPLTKVLTDEDWVNKARDARNHHVRSGIDNCDKCYYEAVGHRSNIIKHFFSDEYIHSQFHKCPNENCEFGYCTLQSLITHAEVIHKGSLRKSESLENQNTGGIFYCIIPKAKEILSPDPIPPVQHLEHQVNDSFYSQINLLFNAT